MAPSASVHGYECGFPTHTPFSVQNVWLVPALSLTAASLPSVILYFQATSLSWYGRQSGLVEGALCEESNDSGPQQRFSHANSFVIFSLFLPYPAPSSELGQLTYPVRIQSKPSYSLQNKYRRGQGHDYFSTIFTSTIAFHTVEMLKDTFPVKH